MKPKGNPVVTDAYQEAFNEVLRRVQDQVKGSTPDTLPIRMYIAGGAALHLLTGERVTEGTRWFSSSESESGSTSGGDSGSGSDLD